MTVVFAGRARTISEARSLASSSEAFAFRWLKLSVAASVTFMRSSPIGLEALEAFLVQDEARVVDSVAALDTGHDVLGAGHLRHRVVADEADRLDPREASRCQAVDQFGASLGRENVLLVLEPVARADVADRDQRTRSGVIRTITRRSPGLWLWNFGLPVYFSDSLSMWRFASSLSSSSTVPLTVTYSYGSSCA